MGTEGVMSMEESAQNDVDGWILKKRHTHTDT